MIKYLSKFFLILFIVGYMPNHVNGGEVQSPSEANTNLSLEQKKEIEKIKDSYHREAQRVESILKTVPTFGLLDFSQIKTKVEHYGVEFYGINDSKKFSHFLTWWGKFRDEKFSSDAIAPFTTDGCSLFPDGPINYENLWKDCCIQHDLAYWMGGVKEARAFADEELKQCLALSLKDTVKFSNSAQVALAKALPNLVWTGVRMGGSPSSYIPWRWGYGWRHNIGYKVLSPNQKESVKQSLIWYKKRIEAKVFQKPFGTPRDPEVVKKDIDWVIKRIDAKMHL